MKLKTTTETIGGIRIQMSRTQAQKGGSNHETALLLSPWPQTLTSFGGIWPHLQQHMNLIAIDLPGFGGSEVVPDRMRPSSQASFLLDVLDHFALKKVHLIGTDVGVPVGLGFAVSSPERLHSMVLSDGPGTKSPALSADLTRMVNSRLFRWLCTWSPGGFVNIAAQNGYARSKPDPAMIAQFKTAHARTGMLSGTLEFLASYPEELPIIDAALHKISTPTLLLWGEKDVFVPPSNAHDLAKRMPNARAHILAGAGHFSHDDSPEDYATAVTQFWGELAP